jgi:hypothetical protein
MSMSLRANVAQVVAKLVARRPTRADEIPDLVRNVQYALTWLDEPDEPEPVEEVEAPPLPRAARTRRRREAAPDPVVEPIVAAPAPRLLRRADVMGTPAPAEGAAIAQPSRIVRGVVKWFDLRSRRGALRLPGQSGDIAIEPALLSEMAITRLYKGQEVEATLSEGETPHVVRLTLPGGAWKVSSAGGIVRNRHAKPVVVELKREAMRRVAARTEAELVLGPTRER